MRVQERIELSEPKLYRSNVSAADIVDASAIWLGGPTLLTGVGSIPTSLHHIAMAGVNQYGRSVPVSGADFTPSGADRAVRITPETGFGGITHYDIFCSTDASPKFVCRASAAQVAAGGIISAQNTIIAGGTPGSLDLYVAGTGLNAFLIVSSTMFLLPTGVEPVTASGRQYTDWDIRFSRTGDSVTPSLTLIPFRQNSVDNLWYCGSPFSFAFGGALGAYHTNLQNFRIEHRGAHKVHLLVAAIAGTGAKLDTIYASLS